MRRNYKRKKFHVSGICIFLVLIIFSVAFVLWAMKPDNFRNEKNKINSWLNGISFQDFYNAKSLIKDHLSSDPENDSCYSVRYGSDPVCF